MCVSAWRDARLSPEELPVPTRQPPPRRAQGFSCGEIKEVVKSANAIIVINNNNGCF